MILDGLDRLIVEFDKALRTVTGPAVSSRPHPDAETPESDLSEDERRHAAALMRVNHSGEVCAQALYQGQALTSRDPGVVDALRSAAHEETEHLAWTEKRIRELAGHTSYLNPLWYAGSLAIGVLAGRFGDRWNLGFLSETERQVEMHLDAHMARLPEQDRRSWEILKQMKLDEIRHADTADALGAAQLPGVVRGLMRLSSKVMTRTAYYV